jgi:L-methionine (R)-S-oxide reductase
METTAASKTKRYKRLYKQIENLILPVNNSLSRMATITAILHFKMNFFWTGFYLLENGELLVGPYQGPLACLKLKYPNGVCWAGINHKESIIVPDVEEFPGHIACNSNSKSEIVIPVRDKNNEIIAILDIDSDTKHFFDETDRIELEKICQLIY